MKLSGFSSLFSRDEGGPGAERRSLFLALAALLVWGIGFSLWSDANDLRQRRILQKKRFDELTAVLGEYASLRRLSGNGIGDAAAGPEEDLLTAITNAVASLGLRSNMQSLSTTTGRAGGNAVSVTMEGLSSEALAKFLQETERRGIFSFSADIRAIRNMSAAAGSPPRSLTAVLLMGRR